MYRQRKRRGRISPIGPETPIPMNPRSKKIGKPPAGTTGLVKPARSLYPNRIDGVTMIKRPHRKRGGF